MMNYPANKTELDRLLKGILQETNLNILITNYKDFYSKFSCKPDKNDYPYPGKTDVIDEDKSVKWNREEVERLRNAYEDRVKELNTCKNLIDHTFERRIIEILAVENDISIAESKKLWSYAYSEGHSDGIYNVINWYNEIVELYLDLLEIRKKK